MCGRICWTRKDTLSTPLTEVATPRPRRSRGLRNAGARNKASKTGRGKSVQLLIAAVQNGPMPDESAWTFTVREWGAGRYRAHGVHRSGKFIALIGDDPDQLVTRLRAEAPDDPVFVCPVCAYDGLTARPYEVWPPPLNVDISPPYADVLGFPSYEACHICGFEFGNDDDPGTVPVGDSFESYRQRWIAAGRPRFGERWLQPPNSR